METKQNGSLQYGLEPENFRIDSTGWKTFSADGVRFKINPFGDVTELIEGQYKGEQFFTWDAAMRETAKAGKRIPTILKFLEIIRSVNPDIDPEGGWQDDVSVRETLGLMLAGFHSFSPFLFPDRNIGYYWTSTPESDGTYYVSLSPSQIDPASGNYRDNGRSVRCLAN